eukprot:283310-Chlamydomonas_euryale.AAC.6
MQKAARGSRGPVDRRGPPCCNRAKGACRPPAAWPPRAACTTTAPQQAADAHALHALPRLTPQLLAAA